MNKIVTFGEVMLRLQPFGYKRFTQADSFEATFGGAEVNVAVSLANFGCNSSFVTKLPDNDIAQKCINEIRGLGVDTSNIVRGGDRMGIYFIEKGASQRSSVVIYDRKHSAISEITPNEIDAHSILSNCKWFHFTGITPALSDNTTETLLELLKVAKEQNITVSADINYRKKLWTKEKANKVMTDIMQYVDVIISNEEDAYDVFGIKAEGSNIENGTLSKEGYTQVARELIKITNAKYVAFTLRESVSASINNWSGILVDKDNCYISNKYTINIIDRVGGGDSFGAGLIYGLMSGNGNQYAIDFAVAASCLKHTIEGDYNRMTVTEVDSLINNGGNGRVKR